MASSSDSGPREFREICKLSPEIFEELIANLPKFDPQPLTLSRLIRQVDTIVGNRDTSRSLVRHCIGVQSHIRRNGANEADVASAIRKSLAQKKTSRSGALLQAWNAIEKHFLSLASLDIFRIVGKTLDLSYEYANLFRGARILTDIRPVFSEDCEKIQAAVVSFSLRVAYDSADGDHELIVALDEADVISLVDQCKRALKKAGTAKNFMLSSAKLPTTISGGNEDA